MKFSCVEQVLRKGFKFYSHVLYKGTIIIAIACILITASLGVGFMFFSLESGTETLFTPPDSQARADHEVARELFPIDYTQFLPDRVYDVDQRQVSVLFYAKDNGNILRSKLLKEVSDFNNHVLSLGVEFNGSVYTFDDLCARYQGGCLGNAVITYIQKQLNESVSAGQAADTEDIIPIPYPSIVHEVGGMSNIERLLGNTQINSGYAVKADFILTTYFLKGGQDEEASGSWEEAVYDYYSEPRFDSIEVAVFPSDGLDRAQRSLTSSVIPFFSITYTLLITFAATSCGMFRDNVQSKPWLAMMGVVSASMAVVSSLGLLSYCGVPFNQVATSVPFLVLDVIIFCSAPFYGCMERFFYRGIGLDDMFILLSAWRDTTGGEGTPRTDIVKRRTEETFREAGVSITITTLTNVIAFGVGAISPLPAIRVFCLYASVAVLFDYLYQITFFGCCLVWFGKREEANRHSWTCRKVRPRGPRNSTTYNVFCSGGKPDDGPRVEHLGKVFFRKYFSALVRKPLSMILTGFVYALYLSAAIYGCFSIQEGLERKNLAEEGSQIYIFLDMASVQLKNTGPSVSLILTDGVAYWEKDVETNLLATVENFESSKFVKAENYTQCWFVKYYQFLTATGGQHDKVTFMNTLKNDFLSRPESVQFNIDIKFDDDNIVNSRCIFVTQNVETANEQGDMMLSLRDLASEQSPSVGSELVVFAQEFIYFEQFIIIIPQTIQTLLIAAASMLLVSLLLIPDPVVAILVSLSVSSILVGVVGFMTYWGVFLEAVSLINLVLCIGFSVDFSAHVAYHFVSFVNATGPNASVGENKVVHPISSALGALGYPIMQSAGSTILGVAILLFFPSYIFKTFAKIIILVMAFGLLHGLLFVPTLLILTNSCRKKVCSKSVEQSNAPPNQRETYDNPAFAKSN